MNQQAYEQGRLCYQNGDWNGAVTYLSAAKSTGELNGEVDHLLGNALMKLGRFDAAASAYGSAIADGAYGKRGALSANRGRALLAAGRAQDAVSALSDAVADASYATPYKAYMALGSAYEALGDVRNAGIAYRSAAIDESNPAPAAALTKLGGCFMRLGRAVDAVEAYRTALDFTTPLEDQNKIWCELGLAYVAANRMSEAVDAFGHATADGSFTLSPEARASYDAAQRAANALSERRPSDTDAFLNAAGYGGGYDPLDPSGASGELMPSPEDTGFFSVTEEDLVQADLAERKVRRKHGHGGLKFLIFLLIVLVLAAGAAFLLYTQGYGWPMQETVVEELFAARTSGTDLSEFVAAGTTSSQISQMESDIPSGCTVSVEGVDRSMAESTVYAVATLSEGGEQAYTISLVRDGISWKVVSVTVGYASEDGTSTGSDSTTTTTSLTGDSSDSLTTGDASTSSDSSTSSADSSISSN